MNQPLPTETFRVGVLGLGIMGRVLAANLEQDGVLAGSWNRTPHRDFPRVADTLAALAEKADILLVVVTNAAAVENVLELLLPALTPRHLVIQCSTVAPASNQAFAGRVTATGAGFIEALIAGSKPAAENRQIIFYMGGETVLIERVEPLLRTLSANCVRVGAVGEASAAKLATNLYLAIQIAALAECYAYARRSGLDDDAFFTVLRNNITWNKMAEFKEPKLRQQDFTPQFSVRNMLKDVRLALDTGGDSDLLPLLRAAERQYQAALDTGFGDEDMIALYKLVND